MQEVVYSVLSMKMNMDQNAVLLIVKIQRLLEYKHVSNIEQIGIDSMLVLVSGFRRMIRRPGETLPWQPAPVSNPQPHDENMPERPHKNYFTPR